MQCYDSWNMSYYLSHRFPGTGWRPEGISLGKHSSVIQSLGGAQGVFTTLHLFISVSLFCGSALFCLSVWRSLSLIVRHTGWAMTAVCHWAKLSFPLARQSRKRERTERMNVMDHCCVPAFPMHMWKMWWHLSLTLGRSYLFWGCIVMV